jgi:hypothetical protein
MCACYNTQADNNIHQDVNQQSAATNNNAVRRSTRVRIPKIYNVKAVDANEKAVMDELKQLLELNCFTPIEKDELVLNKGDSLIPSHMRCVDKYTADGNYDKTKARLVAGGNHINKQLFPDNGSPTLNDMSVMTLLAYAQQHKLMIHVHDIKSFFVRSTRDTTNGHIYIILNKDVSVTIVKIDNNLKKYMDDKGRIIMRLNNALYGTLDAAKTAYKDLHNLFKAHGFNSFNRDPCLMTTVHKL